MLYEVVVNDWGETTYVPTTLGNILLIVLALAVFAVAMALVKKDNTKKITVKQLAFCALSIALATILSFIKLFRFPTGGSLTLLSMLAICLPGYLFGTGTGIMAGIAYGILQLIIEPYVLYPTQLIIDYILAFGAMGLSGIFCNAKHGLLKGYIAAVLGRYVFAVISGYAFFEMYAWEGWAVLPYSLAYNAIYIFSEAAITIAVISIPSVKKSIAQIKTMANS